MSANEAIEFLKVIRGWIEHLGLSLDDVSRHTGIPADKLERMFDLAEPSTPFRTILELLDGLGLGIVGVEEPSPAVVLRLFEKVRAAKVPKLTKAALSERAGIHRTYMLTLFQDKDAEPKLETIMKLSSALEHELVIEQRRPILQPAEAPPAEPPPVPPLSEQPSPPPTPVGSAPVAQGASEAVDPLPSAKVPDRPAVPGDAGGQPSTWSGWPASGATSRPEGATSHPTSATSHQTGSNLHLSGGLFTNPFASPAPPRSPVLSQCDPPGDASPSPSASGPPTPARTSATNATDFAHHLADVARAELRVVEANHELARTAQRHEYERQLAEQSAATTAAMARAESSEKRVENAFVGGGAAAATMLAGSTALAFQSPESRRTAQAMMGMTGGALTLAGALCERDSKARAVLYGTGGALLLTTLIDLAQQFTRSRRGGLGVVWVEGAEGLVIKLMGPTSGARRAGLLPGDRVLRVDDVPVEQIGLPEAMARIRGEPGTPVRILVWRATAGVEVDVVVYRTPL